VAVVLTDIVELVELVELVRPRVELDPIPVDVEPLDTLDDP